MYKFWQKAKKNSKLSAALYGNHNKNLFSNVDQHERMLACEVRVNKYYEGIQRHIKPGQVVVDLGSGTGVLSFFASIKKPKLIYAIDHGNVIELAEYLAEKNGIKNISFFKGHSSKFNPSEKVDVILHEQIGDYLVDEDMIRNICDLRDRILAPGGKILPGEFECYFEPISLKEGKRISFLWEHELHGIKFKDSKEWLTGEKNKIGKTKIPYILTPDLASHFLSKPEPLFTVDLMTIDPDSFPNSFSATKEVIKEGIMDGFCFYFKIKFDDEIEIDTSPFAKPTVWLYQLFRTEAKYLNVGDIIYAELDMSNITKPSSWKVKHSITQNKSISEIIR